MKSMRIGTSQVFAPELVMGSFGMGGGTSWQDTTRDDQELVDFIRAANEIGVSGIDTAPVYGTGRSERIVGQAIKTDRENYYLSTKCCMHWRNATGTFQYTRDGVSVYSNFQKESLIQDVEDSLRHRTFQCGADRSSGGSIGNLFKVRGTGSGAGECQPFK